MYPVFYSDSIQDLIHKHVEIDLIFRMDSTVMSRSLNLRKHHLLPNYAEEIARVIRDNQPVERDRFETLVRDHESLDTDDISRSVRMLRMTDNLEIEDDRARIKSRRCGEDKEIRVIEKFRRWKREAQNS